MGGSLPWRTVLAIWETKECELGEEWGGGGGGGGERPCLLNPCHLVTSQSQETTGMELKDKGL